MIEALGRMVEQVLFALLEVIEHNESKIFAVVIAFAVIVMILDSFYWIR
jgi:hypothetical protein